MSGWPAAAARAWFRRATTSSGVPAGAIGPYQMRTSWPGTFSAMAGGSGRLATRCASATASPRSLPEPMYGCAGLMAADTSGMWPASRSDKDWLEPL